jgi:N-acetylneuraminic acid mutarotase
VRLLGISLADGGVATVDLTSEYQSGGGSLSLQVRLGQVVYTLTQFPTIRSVRFLLDGAPVDVSSSDGIVLDHPVGRADYRALVLATAIPSAPQLAGAWTALPAAPIKVDGGLTSVWTGRELLVYGALRKTGVAAAYDPAANRWRRLPSPGPTGTFPPYHSVWTGKEMLVWGQGLREAYDPAANTWRRLPGSPLLSVHEGHGLVVWTGNEMIGWGGGCCGDAFSDGVAFDPATNRWRGLAQAPLAGSQQPIGAWTGKELFVFVGNLDPNGKPWPKRLARAAAYDPATDSWRRIAPLPAPRNGATAVWDGHEVLVVGGAGLARAGRPAPLARVGFAYDPATNRWRRLPPMESGRFGSAAVWTGRQLLLWGGSQTANGGPPSIPPHGLAYDPTANRWAPLPQAPLLGRVGPTGVWTGREFVVWGGGPGASQKVFADGAAFRP